MPTASLRVPKDTPWCSPVGLFAMLTAYPRVPRLSSVHRGYCPTGGIAGSSSWCGTPKSAAQEDIAHNVRCCVTPKGNTEITANPSMYRCLALSENPLRTLSEQRAPGAYGEPRAGEGYGVATPGGKMTETR
jgi:hypothetical protein